MHVDTLHACRRLPGWRAGRPTPTSSRPPSTSTTSTGPGTYPGCTGSHTGPQAHANSAVCSFESSAQPASFSPIARCPSGYLQVGAGRLPASQAELLAFKRCGCAGAGHGGREDAGRLQVRALLLLVLRLCRQRPCARAHQRLRPATTTATCLPACLTRARPGPSARMTPASRSAHTSACACAGSRAWPWTANLAWRALPSSSARLPSLSAQARAQNLPWIAVETTCGPPQGLSRTDVPANGSGCLGQVQANGQSTQITCAPAVGSTDDFQVRPHAVLSVQPAQADRLGLMSLDQS